MQIATLNARAPHLKNYRSSDCKLLGFDLPSLISTMKQSFSWAKGELNASVLLKSRDKKIILTAMHSGTEIISFQSNESVTFQIIEGTLKFHVRRDVVILNKGQVLTLDEKIRYSLSTEVETVFLLTISDVIKGHPNN
jgi:quercetin dioxygenase-like cupin family protein